MKNEGEKYRKNLLIADATINQLRQELDLVKKSNQEMHLKREKIKEKLNDGINEVESVKEKVRVIENEKNIPTDV